MNFYILDKDDMTAIALVDVYKSYIWAERYREEGDCELYLPATVEMLDLLQIGRFILKDGSTMLCQIKKVTLTTNTEEGDFLTVIGYDTARWLEQRIVWGTEYCDGNIETFVRDLVSKSMGPEASAARQMKKNGNVIFLLGEAAGFIDVATEQMSYVNLSEKIKEYCLTNGWGYRVRYDDSGSYPVLRFELYSGEDRSDEVIFSDEFENIASSVYDRDATNIGNVTLVAGAGEGSARRRTTIGTAQGCDRFEIFTDRRDEADKITYESLVEMYPGGGFMSYGGGWAYYLDDLNIRVTSQEYLDWIRVAIPGGYVSVNPEGGWWYYLEYVPIAMVPSQTPADRDECTMLDTIYLQWLAADGFDKLAEYGEAVSFEGAIEPHVTFEYQIDYFLGDIVTVENHYGVSKKARIIEVVEAEDENGYTCQLSYEYVEGRD